MRIPSGDRTPSRRSAATVRCPFRQRHHASRCDSFVSVVESADLRERDDGPEPSLIHLLSVGSSLLERKWVRVRL